MRFLFILISLVSTNIYAQQYSVSGCVADTSGQTLPDANVLFFVRDSLVAGTTTNSQGCFILNLKNGEYNFIVSKFGYEEYSQNLNMGDNITLPTIKLTDLATELGEVVVEGVMFKAEDMKSIFTISNEIKKKSVDVFQALASIPALIVNQRDKTVAVAGSDEGTVVLVDNIRRSTGYLQSLKPENIDKVEIIRQPGARYRNSGNIVNITTKEPDTGTSVSITDELSTLLKSNYIESNYTWVGKKISASVSGAGWLVRNDGDEFSLLRNIYGSDTTQFERHSTDYHSSRQHWLLSPSIDYKISDKVFTSLELDYAFIPTKINTTYSGYILSPTENSDYIAEDYRTSRSNKFNGDFYLGIKFNKNSTLDIGANFQDDSNIQNFRYKETQTESSYETNQKHDTHFNAAQFEANFQQKTKSLTLEEGYSLYWQKTDLTSVYNGVESPVQKFDEYRHYFYGNIIGKLGNKFSYQLGAGLDVIDKRTPEAHDIYTELIPSAVLRYFMGKSQNLTARYRVWHFSPQSNKLTPNRTYTDTTMVSYGNPALRNYYTHAADLVYEMSKGRFYLTASFKNIMEPGYIAPLNFVENGVYNSTWTNIDSYTSSSLNIQPAYRFFGWWSVQLQLSLSHHKYKDKVYAQMNREFLNPAVAIRSRIDHKNLTVNLYYQFQRKTLTLFGYDKNSLTSSIYATYKLGEHWNAIMRVTAQLPSRGIQETNIANYTEISRQNYRDRMLRISFGINYIFSKGKEKEYQQKNLKGYN